MKNETIESIVTFVVNRKPETLKKKTLSETDRKIIETEWVLRRVTGKEKYNTSLLNERNLILKNIAVVKSQGGEGSPLIREYNRRLKEIDTLAN